MISQISRRKRASLTPFPTILFLALISFFSTGASGSTMLDPYPEPSTTRFGQTLVTLSDINGDGVPDLAVAAPFQDGDFVSTQTSYGTPANVGKIFLLDGSNLSILKMLDDPEFQLIQPQHYGGQLGASMAPVADLNGDGVADLIAGVPHHIVDPGSDNQIANAGEAFVFSGKDGTVLLTLVDPTAEEGGEMGTAVAGLGDVDGDGVPDLVVGVPGKDIGGLANVGLLYVFSGKTGQVIRTINHPAAGGPEAGAAFGSAVANAGDVDKDGVSDILIGAPGEGHAYLFSGKTGSLIFDIIGPFIEHLHSFGAAVAGGMDFDRDGKPDLVVGAPLQEEQRGAAYIFNGSDGKLQRTLLLKPRKRFAKFGAALCVASDLTGDHRPDVAVGAPGQNFNGLTQAGAITIFNGRSGRAVKTIYSAAPQPRALFGAAVTAADFDGDGTATVVAGVPNQDAHIDSGTGPVPHLEIGQIEIQP
jgi:hypothetical protein